MCRIKQCAMQLAVFAVAIVLLPMQAGIASDKTGRGTESFDIPLGGDLLIIPVLVNGANRNFVIDTSARYTALDAQLQGELGDKVRRIPSLGPQGVTSEWTYQSPILRVGQTEFRPSEIVSTEFRAARAAGGHRFDGRLGLDCLESLVLEINCDSGKLRMSSSPAPEHICRGFRKKIVLTEKPKTLCLENAIPGLPVSDSEAFAIAASWDDSVGLREELFDLLLQKGMIVDVRSSGTPLTDVRVIRGKLRKFEFAGKTFATLHCSRMPFNVVGLGLLSRFHVVIDIPQNVMWLEPGKRIDAPDRVDLSGLGFVRLVTDEVVIIEVDPDSPAAKAGIQYADQIVGVRGLEIGKGSLFRLRQRLCEPGPCEVSLLRGETKMKVVLDLK